MKTTIHVNQHKIKKNAIRLKNGEDKIIEPVITVKTYKSNIYANEVIIDDKTKVVYRPKKPLNCGAVCWIETEGKITVI